LEVCFSGNAARGRIAAALDFTNQNRASWGVSISRLFYVVYFYAILKYFGCIVI